MFSEVERKPDVVFAYHSITHASSERDSESYSPSYRQNRTVLYTGCAVSSCARGTHNLFEWRYWYISVVLTIDDDTLWYLVHVAMLSRMSNFPQRALPRRQCLQHDRSDYPQELRPWQAPLVPTRRRRGVGGTQRHRAASPSLQSRCIRDTHDGAPAIMLRKYPHSYTKLYYSPQRLPKPLWHDNSTI